MTCHLELSPVPTDHPVNHQVPQNILWGLLTTLTKEKKKRSWKYIWIIPEIVYCKMRSGGTGHPKSFIPSACWGEKKPWVPGPGAIKLSATRMEENSKTTRATSKFLCHSLGARADFIWLLAFSIWYVCLWEPGFSSYDLQNQFLRGTNWETNREMLHST